MPDKSIRSKKESPASQPVREAGSSFLASSMEWTPPLGLEVELELEAPGRGLGVEEEALGFLRDRPLFLGLPPAGLAFGGPRLDFCLHSAFRRWNSRNRGATPNPAACWASNTISAILSHR